MNIASGLSSARAALLLSVLAASVPAATFTLLLDTLDVRTTRGAQYTSKGFLVNPSSDTLRIDSVSVRWAQPSLNYGQLQFYLVSGSYPDLTLFQGFLASSINGKLEFSQSTRFTLNPLSTARVQEPIFDHCIACPTAKRSAAAASQAVGDTLKAWVTFHSGTFRDSVYFLSIERVSTGLSRRPGSAMPAFAVPGRPLDASGRALRAPARQGSLFAKP